MATPATVVSIQVPVMAAIPEPSSTSESETSDPDPTPTPAVVVIPCPVHNPNGIGIMEAGGFRLVTNKRRKNRPVTANQPFEKYLKSSETEDVEYVRKSDMDGSKPFFQTIPDDLTPANYALSIVAWSGRVRHAIQELQLTTYNLGFFTSLALSLTELGVDERDIKKIVCYGLGSCVKHWQSRYQLAFLVCLKEKLGNPGLCVQLYDPDFTRTDKDVIEKEFGFEVILENEEGNRTVDELTLFYLPHCPHGLCNNVLRANWSPERLSKCIVISNSFDSVCSSLPKFKLQINVPYLLSALPLAVEYKLHDDYKFFAAFFQMSIHIFPISLSNHLNQEFWERDDTGDKK